MKWINLKSNRCPKCGKGLIIIGMTNIIKCSCGFTIGTKRMSEIVSSTIKERDTNHYRPEDENPE